jgi:hypothetical protein
MGLADAIGMGLDPASQQALGLNAPPMGLGQAAQISYAPTGALPGGPPQGAPSMQPPDAPQAPAPMPYPGVTSGVAPGAAPPALDPAKLLALAGQGQPGARAAGFSPTSRTNTGTVYSPETIGAVGDTLGSNRDVADAQGPAEQQEGASNAAMGKLVGAYDQADTLSAKVRRDQQMSTLQGYHDHMTNLMQQADEAGQINPGRYMENKGLAGRLGLGIAAALSGAGAALSHQGGNPVLSMIEHTIDQDVESQRTNASSAASAVGRASNLYELNRQKLGDDERAAQATAVTQRQSFISYLQSQAAQANAPTQYRLHAAQAANELAKKQESELKDLDEKTVHQTTSETFHAASAGMDPLTRLDRAGKIGEATQRLYGNSQDQREKEATIGKTEAEAAHAQAEARTATNAPAAEAAHFEALAKDTGSNSMLSDPLAVITKHIQSTDADKRELANTAYNQWVMAQTAHTARDPETRAKLAASYIIQPGDIPSRIQYKIGLARQNLVGQKGPMVPAEGVTPGLEEDEAP